MDIMVREPSLRKFWYTIPYALIYLVEVLFLNLSLNRLWPSTPYIFFEQTLGVVQLVRIPDSFVPYAFLFKVS